MRRVLVVAVLLTALAGRGAADDGAPAIPPDARVRVWSGGAKPLVGRLRSADAAALVVERGDGTVQTMDRTSISRLEHWQDGPRRRGKATLIGAAIGVAIGAVLGLAVKNDDDPFLDPSTKEEYSYALPVILGGLGAGIGAAIGTSGSRWVEAPPATVRVGATLRTGFTIRF
jgi:hypothetical protein